MAFNVNKQQFNRFLLRVAHDNNMYVYRLSSSTLSPLLSVVVDGRMLVSRATKLYYYYYRYYTQRKNVRRISRIIFCIFYGLVPLRFRSAPNTKWEWRRSSFLPRKVLNMMEFERYHPSGLCLAHKCQARDVPSHCANDDEKRVEPFFPLCALSALSVTVW